MGKIERSEEEKRLEVVRFNNENLYCNKDDVDFLLGLLEEERRKNKVHIEHIENLDKKVANQRQRLRTGINYKRLNVEELCKTFGLVKKSDVEEGISMLEEHIRHCEQEAASSMNNEICHIALKFDKHLLRVLKGESNEKGN